MNIRPIDGLDQSTLQEFGNRKREGRLDLVYDAGSNRWYAVPREIEHSDFMIKLPGNPEELVPVQLRMRCKGSAQYVVEELLVGASSFEAKRGAKHKPGHLKQAYDAALEFLARQGFETDPKRFDISHQFARW